MQHIRTRRTLSKVMLAIFCCSIGSSVWAADHRDGPRISNDISADIADLYFFLDPNDPNRAILIGTLSGFIVPGEAVNSGIFDPTLRYRFNIENTGDSSPDKRIEVRFTPRVANATPQTATVTLTENGRETRLGQALATNPSLASTAPAPVITELGRGIQFFAGETDDPFFFDIPGFSRFVGSVLSGAPDVTRLNRGRDSFAGYNVIAIALSVPTSVLAGNGDSLGVEFATLRVQPGSTVARRVDREGIPAVNVALVPFAQKDAYNAAITRQDSRGEFAPGIVGTLTALGTSPANINALAGLAVTNGDILRLDLSVANQGSGGGNNAGAGFPNGRRLRDDVIDTELFIITNGLVTAGDHVNANDVAFRNTFPFLAPSQQPREGSGNVEDNTRN